MNSVNAGVDENMENTHIKEIDVLFAIAVILVVFGHSFLYPNYTEANPQWYKILRNYVYTFHMPLFFAISGFLVRHRSIPSGYGYNYVESTKKRAIRLLLPYITLTCIALIPKYFLSHLTTNKPPGSIADVLSVLFYPWKAPVEAYWFLPTLFVVSLLTPVFLWAVKNSVSRHLVFCFLLCLAFILPQNKGPQFLNYYGILYYLFFYYLGFYSYCVITEHVLAARKLSQGFWLLASLLIHITGFMYLPENQFTKPLLAIMGIIPAVCFAILICRFGYKWLTPIFGMYFQIYLLSWFFQRVVMAIYRTTDLTFTVLFPLSLVTGIVGPIVLAHAINKWCPVLNLAIGQKPIEKP